MIEWWQAVLIALASSAATGVVALLLQMSQQRHDTAKQQREFRSQEQARREEAARQHSRDRSTVFYDFVELVEREQGRRLLKNILSGPGGTRLKENAWTVAQSVIEEGAWEDIWQDWVASETWPTEHWQDVVKTYSGRFFTVQDVSLRDKLFKLMGHVVGREHSTLLPSEVSQLLLEVRDMIAVKIVDPLDLANAGSVEAENPNV